ncbi:MAG: peroxiredoxin family protein [Gemmataceae bacterium]|nr:peroxiredoxin family protein [Gemmataceae bacterium]
MQTQALLLILSLAVGQPSSSAEWVLSPHLTPGLELTYSGDVVEESLLPSVQFQRTWRVESTVLVLEGTGKSWDLAVMTVVRQKSQDSEPRRAPSSVRLEFVKVDARGRIQGPALPKTPALSGPSTIEANWFVEAPTTRVGRNSFWEAAEEGRLPRTWQVLASEVAGGIACVKLQGQQQSDDWDRPRADQTAWRRRDIVWLSQQMGVACKIERTIEKRDPARREPTSRTVARFDLDSPLRYPGKLFDDRKKEILTAKKFQDDAQVLLKQPAQSKSQIDSLLKRVSYHMENAAPTPYRKAIQSLETRLIAAKKGEIPPEEQTEPKTGPISAIAVGQKVPDFVTTDLGNRETVRLSRLLGRPVFVFFYNPGAESSRDVLRFALKLNADHGDKIRLMAMAATSDPKIALQQQADMKLPFPLLDGNGMHLTFGVDATPRLVLLDNEGVLRCAYTGWGVHIPQEIEQELSRCLTK